MEQGNFTFIIRYTILQVNKPHSTQERGWSSPECIGIPNEFGMKFDKSSDFYVCQKHNIKRKRR